MGWRVDARGWAAVLATLALGCATPGLIVDPCRGSRGAGTGPVAEVLELGAWRRADLPGITLYSVADTAEAERAARDLRAFVRLTSGLVFQEAFSPRKSVHVLLFGRREQLQHFAGCGAEGHAVPGDDVFAVALDAELDSVGVLQHELVHLILFDRTGASYPPWFHEGLAQLLGSAVIRSGVATVASKPFRVHFRSRVEPLPLARLLSSGEATGPHRADPHRFYLDSWAFVHFGLLSHAMQGPRRAAEFMAFVAAASHGEPWRPALERSFGASLQTIEAEYREHRRRLIGAPTHPVLHLRFEPTQAAVNFEPVGEREIARSLGSHALRVGRPALAAVLFERVLADDPGDPAALIGRIRAAAPREEFALADALWERLPPAERETPAGWQAAAEVAHARYAALGERERLEEGGALLARARAAYERVLRDAPERWSALVGLGRTYVLEPDASEVARGIEALSAAARAFPHVARVRLDLGELHLRGGDPERARRHLRYVVEAFPGSDSAERAEDLLDEAEDLS